MVFGWDSTSLMNMKDQLQHPAWISASEAGSRKITYPLMRPLCMGMIQAKPLPC